MERVKGIEPSCQKWFKVVWHAFLIFLICILEISQRALRVNDGLDEESVTPVILRNNLFDTPGKRFRIRGSFTIDVCKSGELAENQETHQ